MQRAPAPSGSRLGIGGRDHGVRRERFVAGMRQAASGVSVVTTDGPGGRFGATVSAMTSVCAEPPALLVCVHHENLVAPAITRNGVFCVNVLHEHQRELSDVFAGRLRLAPGEDRFGHGAWRRLETGAPVLERPLAAFECRLARREEFGSHGLFIGVVVAVHEGSGSPLLYYDRGYRRLGMAREPGAAPGCGPERAGV